MPPPDVVAERVGSVRDEALTELVADELVRMADIDAIVRQLLADHPDLGDDVDEAAVRDRFTDTPTSSWRAVAADLVSDAINAADLTGDVRDHLL